MSRMFEFINECWNPMGGGPCPHRCIYCWSQSEKGLIKKFNMKKYRGPFRLIGKEMKRKFKPDTTVFVQDMSDLFAWTVPRQIIKKVLNHIGKFPETRFLLLTKNPERYLELILSIPENCILGATVETNGWTPTLGHFYCCGSNWISKAPHPLKRLESLAHLRDWDVPHEMMVSIEPILDFDLTIFLERLKLVAPDFVAVGYDNHGFNLPEPRLEKTLKLIRELEASGIRVYRKTIREAWYEKEVK